MKFEITKEWLTKQRELGKSISEIAEESQVKERKVWDLVVKFGLKSLRGKPFIVKCDHCLKPVKRHPSTVSKNNFCSYECYHTWMIGKRTGSLCYNWKGGVAAISSNNLKTPEFQRLRKIILNKFPVCTICGSDTYLQVHHIKPRRTHKELALVESNLITLCKKCNSSIRYKEEQWEEYFMRLVSKAGELLETPNVKTRAISSQAVVGQGTTEGSETIEVSPNNNPLQECPPRKGRYSPSYVETHRATV